MYEKYFKRILDFIISLLALIILSPVFLVVAILIKIKLGNPVIFKQQRPGKDGKIFNLYKFRTMNQKKDTNGELLSDEERITKLGAVLRKLSLDELPQLLNIIKGDMAIIGPRPLLVEYMTLYSEEQKHRHDVRPGITGLAQCKGRNSLSWEEKFNYDIEYIHHVSFFNDIKIILYSVKIVFLQTGIAQEGRISMEKFSGSNVDSTKGTSERAG